MVSGIDIIATKMKKLYISTNEIRLNPLSDPVISERRAGSEKWNFVLVGVGSAVQSFVAEPLGRREDKVILYIQEVLTHFI